MARDLEGINPAFGVWGFQAFGVWGFRVRGLSLGFRVLGSGLKILGSLFAPNVPGCPAVGG